MVLNFGEIIYNGLNCLIVNLMGDFAQNFQTVWESKLHHRKRTALLTAT